MTHLAGKKTSLEKKEHVFVLSVKSGYRIPGIPVWSFLLPVLFLMLAYFLTVYSFWLNGKTLLDADEASEMVLAQHLNEEGGILSRTWFYSTELRVINTQLIYKIGLYLFPTNWHAARTFSVAVMMLILSASYLYLAYQAGLGKYGLWSAVALMMPFSTEYSYTVLYGSFYVPHISIMFLSLGLFLRVLRSRTRIARLILLILSFFLAFASGLGGVRQFLVLYAPLFMTLFLLTLWHTIRAGKLREILTSQSGKAWLLSLALLMFCVLGVGVNSKILSRLYTFEDYSDVSLNSIDLNRFWGYLDSWFQLMGYEGCVELKDITGLAAICGLILCFLALLCLVVILYKRKELSSEERIVVLFSLVSLILNTFFYLLANNPMPRYLIPAVVMTFPVMVVGLRHLPQQNGFWVRACLAAALLCLFGQSLNYMYYHAFKDHGTILTEEEKAADWLTEHGYQQGYATYWNANSLVELSDGQLEIWEVDEAAGQTPWYHLENARWLQVKAHTVTKPSGKVFLLLTSKEVEEGREAESALTDPQRLVYQTDAYSIFAFESAEQMMTLKDDGMSD